MMMEQNELREILEEFFTEADESLDALEQDLIRLETLSETGGRDSEVIDRLFRVVHTLKGGAGFLGLDKVARLAHAGENLLDEVRSGKLDVTKAIMDALLKTNDALKELLAIHKAEGDPEQVEIEGLVGVLHDLVNGGGHLEVPVSAAPSVVPVASIPPVAEEALETAPHQAVDLPLTETGQEPAFTINADLLAEIQNDPRLEGSLDKGDDDLPAAPAPRAAPVVDEAVRQTAMAELSAAAALVQAAPYVNTDLLAEIQADPRLAASLDKGDDDMPSPPVAPAPSTFSVPEQAAATPSAPPLPAGGQPIAAFMRGDATPPERREKEEDRRDISDDRRNQNRRASEGGEATIRVETSKLDKTMNLVGELVLARNSLLSQLSHPLVQQRLNDLDCYGQMTANIEQLSRVTQDLQMSVLSTRMQPIKKVFDKIPRQVRELKNKLGKEIDVILEGEDTEVDKTLVEELSDPMVHLIRNSLDHGIETPDVRIASGKNPTGTLSVRAFYEGNNVVIQITDDGKGIDPHIIRKVAVRKGVIDEYTANAMSDKDAIRLILAPGFSTAEQISDVSGRGVGMDVVNSKIMAVKGTVDIRSEVGIGTTISIYLPLTLAIVQALVVQAHSEGFAVPIGDISEVIKFQPEEVHQVNDQDVIELRGEVLPLYYLHHMTHQGTLPNHILEARAAAFARHTWGKGEMPEAGETMADCGYVIVVKEGSNTMGVVADKLVGQEEAVVKPLTNLFEHHKAISGATITGDGTVHMILDVPFLMKTMVNSGRVGRMA